MLSVEEIVEELRTLRANGGYSKFDQALRILNRERLENRSRPHRKHFPPSVYQKLFDFQTGHCPYCTEMLEIPARRNHIDHINPNADENEYNSRENLFLSHADCNMKKGAVPLAVHAKSLGMTIFEILSRGGR